MVYTYTPTYYSSLQDTVTSLCKNILPFSLKTLSSKRLTCLSAEQKLAKQQTENLKWQQEMFHRILNLIGLNKEGIVPENEVTAFRCQLLDTVIASPVDQEPIPIIRDKLLFLQDLFYAKCISAHEYHSSKRPLLQRLAAQGAEIDCKDVITGAQTNSGADKEEELWSVVSLIDKNGSTNSSEKKNKAKHRSPMKQIKGAMSKINFSSHKTGKSLGSRGLGDLVSQPLCSVDLNVPSITANTSHSFKENPFWNIPINETDCENNRSAFMQECSPPKSIKGEKERGREKSRKKAFHGLFHKEVMIEDSDLDLNEKSVKSSAKKQWGFKRWKRSSEEDDESTHYLPQEDRSDDVSPLIIVTKPVGEGPDTKLIKKKLHSDGSASDFFIDKVLGENIKKELSRIQAELCTANPNLKLTNDQLEAISTRLPVDKSELKKFFPKSWCDRYGDIVLEVVRKEFKDHVGEMESLRNATRERLSSHSWRLRTFGDENCSPNYNQNQKEGCYYDGDDSSQCFSNNPFHDHYDDHNSYIYHGDTLVSEPVYYDQNPFLSRQFTRL